MLVRITNKCRMACSHCMIDATPDGEHMSVDTFIKVLALIKQYQLTFIMVSGGEPLEHPDFFELMDLTKDQNLPAIILSNGMFLEDQVTRDRVLALETPVQITNDPRFYPKTISKFKHPLISYEDHIRTITTLGRAKENELVTNRIAPMCYNLRSFVRKLNCFWSSVFQLRTMGKLCSPSINIDGSISAGESSCCHRIGTIESADQELTQNLLQMKCNLCGMEDRLSPMYLQAIGIT